MIVHDLIQLAIGARQNLPLEVHDLEGNRYEPLNAGIYTKHHIVDGMEEPVFVIRVVKVGTEIEQ